MSRVLNQAGQRSPSTATVEYAGATHRFHYGAHVADVVDSTARFPVGHA